MENSGQQPQQTGAAAAPASATSALDAAIFTFWHEFVAKQVQAGRRDVARMLEVALGFFFDRSQQGARGELQRRAAAEMFLRTLREEMAKVDAALAKVPEAGPEVDLPEPYTAVQIMLRDSDLANPVVVTPMPARLLKRMHLVAYRFGLGKQMMASERLLELLTDKLVANRRLVAQRLKELSPTLYAHGMKMVANAPPLEVPAPPPVEVPAPPPQALPELPQSAAGRLAHGMELIMRICVMLSLRALLFVRDVVFDLVRNLGGVFVALWSARPRFGRRARAPELDSQFRDLMRAASRWNRR